jgi:hypothetical protein|nr:MAG TPA: hypothetical protein [Caudoviricetes sp.]
MKALLNSGEWVNIDTSCLFHNQYNTEDGKRIFDKDISRIVDDKRSGMGRCKYCGALVKRGEEEKHFQEKEKKGCAGCFWQRERVKNRKVKNSVRFQGRERITVKTTIEEIEKVCSYGESNQNTSGCTLKECRRMGIEWFTPENTFFLKYPNGFSSIPEIDKLKIRGFVINDHTLNAEYFKKVGSYTLTALLSYEDGKATGIRAYRLYNCRRDYTFRFENGELFTDKYSFGWYEVKTLEGVPASVMNVVKNICRG